MLSPTGKILFPSLIRLHVRESTLLSRRLGLANHVLAIEDEEGRDAMLLELGEIIDKVSLDPR